jgi:hypothetical protein
MMAHRLLTPLLAAGLALAVVACGSGTPTSSGEPAAVESAEDGEVAANRTGFVGWDRVRPEKAEETGMFGGDEPFVAVLRIRSTTGVAKSTKWAWVTDNPEYIKDSAKANEERNIPDGTGDAWFDGDLAVRPLEETQLIGMNTNLNADIMVTVAFVFDKDNGDTSADVRLLKSLTDPVVRQVATIVEGAKIPLSVQTVANQKPTIDALNSLVSTAKKIKAPTITLDILMQLLQRFVTAYGDANDVIGVATTAFIPTSGQLIGTLERVGIKPQMLGLFGQGEGDGNQAWTKYETWRYPFTIPYTGEFAKGFIAGEVWYGFLTDRWVDDWMYVESEFPWQTRVKYWLKVTAAMRG